MMKRILMLVVLVCAGMPVMLAQTIVPAQTDEIIIDNGASGTAGPGDRIRYKVTIQNTGGPAGTNTQLNIVPDPRTTFVTGTFRSSPLALPDAYTCTGNVGINILAANGVKANDFDDNVAGLTITAGTFATTQGGSIMLNTDGSFMYTPPAGFTGTDTYTYTLNDGNGVGAPVPATDPGLITFTVSNLIWFVDNSVAGPGAGTVSDPFKTLASAQSASAVNQVIFVKNTGTSYTGGITLKNGQYLFGTGHTGGSNLADAGVLPFTMDPNSKTLPAINGTRPVIVNASGDGVTLAQNNTVNGLDLGNASGTALFGSTIGTLTLNNVSINTNAQALTLVSGIANATFTSITSTGGANNILLNVISGTINLGGGALSGATGRGFYINGGSGTVSYSGSITNSLDQAVHIRVWSSGTVTLSGNINSTGVGLRFISNSGGTITLSGASKIVNVGANDAVSLSSNTGATINFSGGGLAISTTSGLGFNAVSGGTVTVTGTGNTINSGTGTALNIANTTIGGSGLNFRSIAANGGTNGIVLNTTGSSGSLTVTGTGSAGTGGTIQNCTGPGVSLTSTFGTSLSYMNIQGGSDDGINGSSVTGFTLANCTVNNNGNSTTDEGIEFSNLLGTCSITNSNVTNNAHNNFRLDNTSGNLVSFTVSGSTFEGHNNATNFGNHGFLFETRVSALVTAVSITGSTFRNNFSIGMQVLTGDNATISSYVVSGCTFSDTGTGNSQEISADFAAAGTSSMTFKFLNNTITGHNSHGFNCFTGAGAGTTGTFNGTISGNTIGNAAIAGSGSLIGNGMRINLNGDKNARILVENNVIRQCPNGRGIEVICRNGTGGADVTVLNNDVNTNDVSGFPLCAILLQSNDLSVPNTLRADVRGNTVLGGVAFDVITTFIGLVETGTSTLQLVDTAPASANATAQLTSTNTGSASANAGVSLIAGPINLPPP